MDPSVRDLTLPSGGTVRWRDIETVLGEDQERVVTLAHRIKVDDLRRRDLILASIAVLLESWDLPALVGLASPKDDPTVLRKLRLPDYRALYGAGEVVADLAFADEPTENKDPGEPGSPTEPGTDSVPS